MAPVVLEGATLGQRHQHYNQLLKEATANGKAEPDKIDYNKNDIDNLFNIDIACENHDVDYIIDVFKGQDMLYISRAVKQSNWLITDAQYAHIINPEYLHSTLFPLMMPKASAKLLLHIRLTLKNESRVDKFFQYFKEKDFKTALKWLPNCPIKVIEEITEKYALQISTDIFKRLCERSPKVLEIFIKATQGSRHHGYLEVAIFLLNSDPELYIDALEKADNYSISFNKKYTKILMKECPQRIINKLEKYYIHRETFAKYLKAENIKSFILKQLEDKEVKRFNQFLIHDLIKYMPQEEKYEFVKQFLDEKIEPKGHKLNRSKIYFWYEHAPFNVAFPELKKLMHDEPTERHHILRTMITTAGNNVSHIRALLQYFRETYMNESIYFHEGFIVPLLRKIDVHLLDRTTWTMLDAIFRNMKVYDKNANNCEICVKAIIGYKLTQNEPVPSIIEQKLRLEYLYPQDYPWKCKGAEQEKLFNYLFNLFQAKLNNLGISTQAEFDQYVKLLKECLLFLRFWEKQLADYPIVIDKMKECVKIKNEKGLNSLSYMALYGIMKKSWKKAIFEDSLILFPSQKICMNILKHDPKLLIRLKSEVNALCCNDTVRMDKVLDKIRVYWPQSLASEWTMTYRDLLSKPDGHKAVVRGLCCLLNQHQLLEFLKEHKPHDKAAAQMSQANNDKLQLSLCKNIAQNMHIARPQVTPDTVLWYAESDYAQLTQLSLNSVILKLRPIDSYDCIQNLLNGVVSLQKHGIYLARAKLSTAEMIKILEDFWKTTKDPSVRAVLFHNTHKLLCEEKDEVLVAELWKLMQTFIDSLTAKEDKTVYYTLGNVRQVHPSVKPAYYMKSYMLLKSLPRKSAWKTLLRVLKAEMSSITEKLDSDFVASMIEEYVDKIVLKHEIDYNHQHDMKILTTYLITADDSRIQNERFKKVFVPLIEKLMPLWDFNNDIDDIDYLDDMEDIYGLDDICDSDESEYISLPKRNVDHIIQHFLRSTNNSLQNNKNPSFLYRNMLNKLSRVLPTLQNIVLFRQLKLAAGFIDILDKTKSNTKEILAAPSYEQILNLYSASAPDIAKAVIRYVKEDIDQYGPLFYKPMAEAFNYVFEHIGYYNNNNTRLRCIRCMLREKDFIPICLLVIEVLPAYWINDLKETNKNNKGEDERAKIIKEIHAILLSHPAQVVQLSYMMKITG